jgi:hypothetical protein
MGGRGSEPFSKYRQLFVRDGWEVIDTPQLTTHGKTSADIHIVMDVLDTVTHYPHVSEYIIMAADADFTPLVTRLRKHMKTTIIYQAKATAAAYTAACDSVIDEELLIELLLAPLKEDLSEGAAGHRYDAPAIPQARTTQVPLTQEGVAEAVRRYFAESGSGYQAPVSSIIDMLKTKWPKITGDWLGNTSASQMLRNVCRLKVSMIENRTVAWIDEDGEADDAAAL